MEICKYETLSNHIGHELVCEQDEDNLGTVILCADCLEELCKDTDNSVGLNLHIGHTLVCEEFGSSHIGIECKTCERLIATVDVADDYKAKRPKYVFEG